MYSRTRCRVQDYGAEHKIEIHQGKAVQTVQLDAWRVLQGESISVVRIAFE